MRIIDWSSDLCSSDLSGPSFPQGDSGSVPARHGHSTYANPKTPVGVMSAQIAEGASDVGNAGIRIFVMREMSARGMRVQEMEIIILRGRTLHKCLNPKLGRHPWQVLTTQQGNAGRGLDAGRAIVRRNPGMQHRFAIKAGGRGEAFSGPV